MAERDEEARVKVRKDFEEAVNMSPAELESWLDTDESKSVGDTGGSAGGNDESTGHKSGKRIVEIKRTKVADLTEDDHDWMAKVTGYVHRHSAQSGPEEDKAHSNWRYSLMNWGHDPLK